MARILDLAVELAVREGAGTAFAELHVRFRMQGVLAPEVPSVFRAFAHLATTFQNQWPETRLGEDQRRKDSRRAETDNDGTQGQTSRRLRNEPVGHVGRRPDMRISLAARQHGGFVSQLKVEAIDKLQCGFLARVRTALVDAQLPQVTGCEMQPLQDGGGQLLRCVFKRQPEFREAQHY